MPSENQDAIETQAIPKVPLLMEIHATFCVFRNLLYLAP
jgi:hypothetical protein